MLERFFTWMKPTDKLVECVVLVDPATGLTYAATGAGGGGGTVAIDQTTPGTTNRVNIGSDGSVAVSSLPTSAATSTNQATEIGYLTTISTNTTNQATAIGSQSDAAATSDTGTFSFISLFKRSLSSLTSILGKFTDGTQLTRFTNGTQTADTFASDAGQNGVVIGPSKKIVTYTAVTTQQVIDVTNFSSISMKVTAITGSWSFSTSNDGTNYTTLPLQFNGLLNNPLSNSASGVGDFYANFNAKFLRINPGTSLTATVSLSSNPIPYHTNAVTASCSQSGTWVTSNAPTSLSNVATSPIRGGAKVTNLGVSGASNLYSTYVYNDNASASFIQIFDSSTLPADGAVPAIVFPIAANSSSSFNAGQMGCPERFTAGIYVVNSTTAATKTIATGANCFITINKA